MNPIVVALIVGIVCAGVFGSLAGWLWSSNSCSDTSGNETESKTGCNLKTYGIPIALFSIICTIVGFFVGKKMSPN